MVTAGVILVGHLSSCATTRTRYREQLFNRSTAQPLLASIQTPSSLLLCSFDKIIRKEISSQVVYEDEKVLAFREISPQAPINIVTIPKAEERHVEILGHLLYAAKIIAKQEELDYGFRVVINDGPNGCQSVYHLHVHLLGGRQMNSSWVSWCCSHHSGGVVLRQAHRSSLLQFTYN